MILILIPIPISLPSVAARTIYVGTLKGALHTVDRDDLADVQAHRLGQVRESSS